jgi:hypothetical protein
MAAALAYLLVAGSIGLLLRRFARVAPATIVVLMLLPLLLSGRALLTGGVYGAIDLAYTSEPLASLAERSGVTQVVNPNASDVYAQFIPWHAAVRDALRHHQWPLWDPFELCGTVLAGAVQLAPYHPLHVIGLALPLPAALTFIATMVFFLAAVSMFLFVRQLVSADEPALLAGAIWMLAPHVGGFALTAYALSLCTMPLVLVAARGVAGRPSWRNTAILTAMLCVTVLAGHPETTLHIVAVATGYFFYERWHVHDGQWTRAVVMGLLSGLLALLLTAFALLPFIEAARQTAEYRDRQTFVAVSWKPIRSLHALRDALLPFPLAQHGADPESTPGAAYAGGVALALAVIGVARRRDWFFVTLFTIGLLAGVRAALFSDALRMIPLFSIAANEHLLWCCAFAVATLAAFGLDAICAAGLVILSWRRRLAPKRSEGPPSCLPPPGLAGWGSFAVLRASGASATQDDKAAARIAAPTQKQLAIAFSAVLVVFAILAANDIQTAAAARLLLPLLLAAAASMAVRQPRVLLLTILLLVIVQRAGETARFRTSVSRAAFYPAFRGLELLRANEPFRVVGQRSILPPNIGAHYRLEDPRGYQAMTLARFSDAERFWSTPQSVWSNRVETLDLPILSLMNVRYAIARKGSPLPPYWTMLSRFDGYDIAENTRVLPRAFVPAMVHAGANRAEAFDALKRCDDFAKEAWIEGGERGTRPNGPGTLTTRVVGSKIDIRASMAKDGWVVLSESAWDGWHASIDGTPTAARIADATFLGVYVPKGEHHVRLVYQPLSFALGGAISALTALLLLVVAVARLLSRGIARRPGAARN